VPLIEQFKSGPLSTTKFNTGEAAVVRIMIKHKKLTLSEIAEEDKQFLEKAKKAEKAQAGRAFIGGIEGQDVREITR